MKSENVNIQAYDNVEQLKNFDDIKSIELYRNERLTMYKDHVSYVQSTSRDKKLNIIEIGSGSSAFLFQLNNQKLLERGVGIEISNSRYQFAEKWKSDLNNQSIENINANFNEVILEENYYDIIFCIDNTLSYLQPENKQYPNLFIEKSRKWLKRGGLLILEMHNYNPIIEKMNDNILYFLKRNKASNPFDYSLYYYEYDENENQITTHSKYLSKTHDNKEKKEISFVYNIQSLTDLIDDKFKIDDIYSNFKKNQFFNDSEEMVLVCQKTS